MSEQEQLRKIRLMSGYVVDATDGRPTHSGVVAVMVVCVQEPVKGSRTLIF